MSIFLKRSMLAIWHFLCSDNKATTNQMYDLNSRKINPHCTECWGNLSWKCQQVGCILTCLLPASGWSQPFCVPTSPLLPVFLVRGRRQSQSTSHIFPHSGIVFIRDPPAQSVQLKVTSLQALPLGQRQGVGGAFSTCGFLSLYYLKQLFSKYNNLIGKHYLDIEFTISFEVW